MGEIIGYLIVVIDTLVSLYLTCVILRFLAQIARADFHNPASQAIVKITNPLLMPLRKIVPGLFGIDLAAIILALLIQIAFGEIVALILLGTPYNPGRLLIWGLIATLHLSTYIAYGCLLIIVIASFIAPYSQHPIIVLVRQLMEPLLRPVQRIIPPVGIFDLSILFVFLAIGFVQTLLRVLASETQLISRLVIGF